MHGNVSFNGGKSGNYPIDKLLKHGCCLRPLLFIAFINQIIKHCKRKKKSLSWKVDSEINTFRSTSMCWWYTDDICSNIQVLQQGVVETNTSTIIIRHGYQKKTQGNQTKGKQEEESNDEGRWYGLTSVGRYTEKLKGLMRREGIKTYRKGGDKREKEDKRKHKQ